MSHHITSISIAHSRLLVRQTLDVQGGVGQHRVHEGETKDGGDHVDDGHHHQVPVVRVALLQVVLRTVDHGCADVLIHEEEDGEGETKNSCEEHGANIKFLKGNKIHGDVVTIEEERIQLHPPEASRSNDTEDDHCHWQRVV